MRYSHSLAALLLCLLSACQYSTSFNQKVWLANSDVSDTHNSRAKMVEDLMQHQLKPGMSRQDLLFLLGPPYKEGVEQRMPRGAVIPDSIEHAVLDTKTGNSQQALNQFNKYYQEHAQPDTLMLYPVGWSIIDPRFLAVKFDGEGKVLEYWVEEH